MTTLATMLAAAQRLLNYYNGDEKTAQNPGGLTGVGGMADNWDPCIQDIGTVANGVGDAMTAASASEGNAAGSAEAAADSALSAQQDAQATAADRQATGQDRQATAADRQAVAQDRTAVEGSASAAATSATLSGQYAAAAGGSIPSVRLTWDTATADADPGNGKVRLNNATPSAATALYVDNLDAAGASIATVLDRWTASTNTTKGTLRIAHRTDATKWVEYLVTGTVVDGTGYRKITVTGGTGPGGFAAGDPVAVGFSRAGDAGVTPSSFSSGTAAAPGWAVTGDPNTGVAQVGGADTLSLVGGGSEALRIGAGQVKAIGVLTSTGTIGTSPNALGSVATNENEHVALFNNVGNVGAYNGDSLRTRLRRLTDGADWTGVAWEIYRKVDSSTHGWVRFGGTATARIALGFGTTERVVVPQSGAVTIDGYTVYHAGNFSAGVASFPSAGQKTGAYSVTAADAGKSIPCSGSWTLSLLTAATAGNGFGILVKNTGSGSISIAPTGSDLIDTAPSGVLAPGGSVILICDGTRWMSIGGVGWSASGAAWSPTAKSTTATLSNGNLTVAFATSSQWRAARAGSQIPSGKYYWEVRCDAGGTDGNLTVGVLNSTFSNYESAPNSPAFYRSMGNKQQDGSGSTAYGSTWTAGDVIGVAVDAAAGKIWWSKNGVWQASGDPATGANAGYTGLTGTLYPAVGTFDNATFTGRFKSADLGYSIPSGFSTIP